MNIYCMECDPEEDDTDEEPDEIIHENHKRKIITEFFA